MLPALIAKKVKATVVNLSILRYQHYSAYGWVAEWSIAHAWKACIPKGIGGSNPPPSASIVFMRLSGFLGVRKWQSAIWSVIISRNFCQSLQMFFEGFQKRPRSRLGCHGDFYDRANTHWGSKRTAEFAEKHRKPWIHMAWRSSSYESPALMLHRFVEANGVRILNVAGTRGSKEPDVWKFAYDTLEATFFWEKGHPGLLGGPGEG